MKILYITTCWTGLGSILFEGYEEAKGMPAFINPLKRLCELGNEIDMYLIHNLKGDLRLNINAEWAKKINILEMKYYPKNLKERFKCIREMNRDIKKILKKSSYDFIYAHGSAPGSMYKQIKKSDVPYGHRLYGSFLNDEIQKHGYIKAKYKHYIEYSVFKKRKSFLLVTDDGSKGDLVYKKITKGVSPYEFVFWRNGADKMPEKIQKNEFLEEENRPVLFYLARVSKWKGQHKAIKLLKYLKDDGIEAALYISGQIIEPEYYNELITLANNLKVDKQVYFTGAINKEKINSFVKKAVASLSLYDVGNRGNVFYEYLSAGAVIISLDDGSLDDFIVNGENGYLVKKIEDIPSIISKLINNEAEIRRIRNNAQKTFNQKMKSWDERVEDEIELIRKYLK